MPLYTQFEESGCDPLPQVTEQIEPILQDDQVGHDCVLQDVILFCSDSPLSKNNGSWLFRVYVNVTSVIYTIRIE